MDVEQIQKINNLAVDLMKQGLAQNREEAIAQAEKTFSEQDSVDYNSMKETLEEVKSENQSQQVEQKNDTEIADLSTNEIKKILEQNTKFMVKTIRNFQEKVANLEKEMSSLKNELRYQKLPTVNEIVSKKEVPPPEELVPENHPKSGRFNGDDVSIEKFFYMGDK